MKIIITLLFLFVAVFAIYFGISTRFTFHPGWTRDYFNPLADALMHGRLNILNPPGTYDLVYFEGKWYAPWGALSALFFIPLQLIKGQYVPSLYISLFFGSLSVCVAYLMASRMQKELFPWMNSFAVAAVTILFAFGTANFYLSTLGSVWHVDQVVSSFFGNLAVFFVLKKKRTLSDYFYSCCCIALTILGRATLSLLVVLPTLFFLKDYFPRSNIKKGTIADFFRKGIIVFVLPLSIGTLAFFLYNILRFGNPFEYGYQFIHEALYLEHIRLQHGIMSLVYLPVNLWYMLLEIPKITMDPYLRMDINLKGNSIFFLTPAFFAIFLASPVMRRSKKLFFDWYSGSIWITVLLTMLPSLLIYSTGWVQFGYRYSLDVTLLLVVLSVYGMKGKFNILYYSGIVFSIIMYCWGISILQ